VLNVQAIGGREKDFCGEKLGEIVIEDRKGRIREKVLMVDFCDAKKYW
jgi:hypothetical protein